MAIVIDKYGRVLIPKEIRGRLGLKPNMALELIVKGNEVILRPRSLDLERRVEELSEYLAHEAPEAFVNELREGDSKWLSKKYCLKKLGLLKE
ncbi:MAG: AbrB/MazE/SpoVT family DNA-binding domain-containing protein [Nitrososphaerales archaeon]